MCWYNVFSFFSLFFSRTLHAWSKHLFGIGLGWAGLGACRGLLDSLTKIFFFFGPPVVGDCGAPGYISNSLLGAEHGSLME